VREKEYIMDSRLNTHEVNDAYKKCRAESIKYELDRGRVGEPAINPPVLRQLAAGGPLAVGAVVLAEEVCGTSPTDEEMEEAHRDGRKINCVEGNGAEFAFYVE